MHLLSQSLPHLSHSLFIIGRRANAPIGICLIQIIPKAQMHRHGILSLHPGSQSGPLWLFLPQTLRERKGLFHLLPDIGKIFLRLEAAAEISLFLFQKGRIKNQIPVMLFQGMPSLQFSADPAFYIHSCIGQIPHRFLFCPGILDAEGRQTDGSSHPCLCLVLIFRPVVKTDLPAHCLQLYKKSVLKHLIAESPRHTDHDHAFPP